MNKLTSTALTLLIAGASPFVFAHGDESHVKKAAIGLVSLAWGCCFFL